jgi:hypothetical protein
MGLPSASSEAGRLSLRVAVPQSDGVTDGVGEIGPSIIEGYPWTIMLGLTCRWNRAACARWTPLGRSWREAKIASEPEALIAFLTGLDLPLVRLGLQAGPLSQWLHAALVTAGHDAVLLETRHVKAALSAMVVKTDRKDARGIAQLLRMGWFRPVHCKSVPAQEVRHETRKGGARPQAGGDPSPDVGGRHHVLLGPGGRGCIASASSGSGRVRSVPLL